MTPDLIAGITAVVAVGLAGLLLVCVAIALHPAEPAPVPPAPARSGGDTTVGLPCWWIEQAAAEGQRRRERAAEVAAMFPPPPVRDATWFDAPRVGAR